MLQLCTFAAFRVNTMRCRNVVFGSRRWDCQPAPKRVVVCFRLPCNALDTLGWRRARAECSKAKQRRQFLEDVRLPELRQYRWDLTVQPKEPTKQSKTPETSTTLVGSIDSEWMEKGHLQLRETPNIVWPGGRMGR